jgi:Flp pilus assembly protein protease CpaA
MKARHSIGALLAFIFFAFGFYAMGASDGKVIAPALIIGSSIIIAGIIVSLALSSKTN